ncbi:hypothetical protein BGZ46_006063 [Entomortierella lignicola]|nr:hypothetical protein BGZ46_006063 [Entomortierella lignicola]
MDTLSYTNNSGGYRGDRGGFRAPFRGRGRGRGDETGQQDTGGEAHQPGQAFGRGRGRGRGWISEEQQAQIVAPRRPLGNRVSSEGTDDIIIAAAADRQLQHVAGFILRKKDFTQFNSQKFVRSFINSCLLNLSNHHGVDTSSILTDLGSQTGCARLTDIMLMNMDIDAGDERETLSFQFVILPLIGVLTREAVCQSTLSNESGLIYSTAYQLREQFLENGVLRCMDRLIERGSLKDYSLGAERLLRQDSSVCKISSLQRALIAVTRLVYQFIKRFKDARIQLGGIIKKLHRQQVAILQLGTDSDEDRYLDIVLASEISRLQKIVNDTERSIANVNSSTFSSQATTLNTNRPNMVYLTQTYDPPGNKSPRGPRHDNDHEDITDIKVLPTRDEITSDRPAFLPSNGVPDAPHFLPPGWKRQLDIHFRLYREDMLDSLRRGVKAFLKVLEETPSHNEDVLLQKKELRRLIGSNANVNLDVYGDVRFLGMDSSKGSSGSIMITFSQPPQLIGLNQAKREEFWERSKRRLTQGSLVSIVCHSSDNESENVSSANGFQMLLGAITRRDVKDLSKDQTTACIYISLTDPEQYIKMLNSATQLGHPQYFLVESMGGFFESYKPILKALQNSFNLAAAMPFGKYLAPTSEELEATRNGRKVIVDPPVYARAPGFKYDLSVLIGGIDCDLDITDPLSIAHAERMIQNHSIIDETQAKALVETLSREVALISGPPGTGKTKIGVDLIRVLLHNKSKVNCVPILCICYTNHALDQFLEHLLDAGITDIVRVGARSKSTRLEDFNLESLLNAAGKPQGVRDILRAVAEKRSIISVEINRLEKILQSDTLTWEFVGSYLATYHVDQWEQFTEATESQQLHDDADYTMDGWSEVQSRPRVESEQVYLRWVNGEDINEMIQANREISQRKKIKSKHFNSFAALDEDDSWQQEYLRPQRIPKSRRPLSMLNGDIWEMSMYERRRLVDSWRRDVQESMMANMSRLLEHSEKLMKRKNDAYDEIRRTILLKTSVIGMTTNGAAKLQSLVEAVSPKIIICEEAGEVLEAHILAALSDSTQHLILIGDHLQLRPQIETYGLSTDSPVGRSYNLDKSLFERLVTAEINPLPMSRLTIQRRMRPSISNLIRKTLYHDLADGPNVLSYPPLSGMGANLFFMDHKHPEDSKDQYGLQSYANTFEVNMVEALVQYLIKNGYDQPGDIAVLTPYLGQLSKLRDRLRESFLLVIDERDQEQLDEKEMENIGNTTALKTNENVNVKRLNLQSHLTLRTIDNYQGEEAKIVIISLVRSDITPDELVFKSKSSIGFLKSKNRTNVLLSRAQHGMFLIGNAELMGRRENGMWPDIIELLEKQDAVGEGLPLVCKNHPEKTSSVTTPKEFKTIAPNGGCIQPCGSNMPCGHVCPLSCHPDDMEHRRTKCNQPCPRLRNDCDHVCPKRCGEICGNCMQPVAPFVLPCGHIYKNPRCWESKDPSKIVCRVKISQKLASCEHEHTFECHVDISTITCNKQCGRILDCGHNCTRSCSTCQKASISLSQDDAPAKEVPRTVHGSCMTKCGRIHFCGHACDSVCHEGKRCPPCDRSCEAVCSHSRCTLNCEVACAACCEQCTWECPHQGSCNMPCGAPCDRLPCDKRCEKILYCGHQCPSVCGEPCPTTDFCVECKDPKIMDYIVDVVMQQSLSEIDVDEDPILVLACGHILTMTSLDGMMDMKNYYIANEDPKTGEVEYIGKRDLPGEEVSQVPCHLCRKPIIELRRYGRRIKYAQLSLRLKKHQVSQGKIMKDALQAFQVAQVLVEEGQSEFLKAILRVEDEVNSELPSANQRNLGKYTDYATFPNSSFLNISNAYHIPKDHEKLWRRLLRPVSDCFVTFKKIYTKANKSPSKQVFDAAFSHLYRIKAGQSHSLSDGAEEQGVSMSEEEYAAISSTIQSCVLECGLPRDGHSGSSHVESLHEMTNVLILVLAQAFEVLKEVGSSSGWYWFVEDLFQCAGVYVDILKDAAQKGRYDRNLAYARMSRMELLLKIMQWLGMVTVSDKLFDAKMKRIDSLTEQFMIELNEINGRCPLGIKEDCVARAKVLEERMVDATAVAKNPVRYQPVTKKEKLELFRAMSQEVSGAGHWYRCQNGHSYFIGNCGGANQESRCYDCGAPVGGSNHRLQSGNSADEEFEGFHRQGQSV